jgi:hypothetical protein
MDVFDILALIYLFGCLCVIGFQFALILGAPWGPITQGGAHPGPLPLSGRIVAGLSVFIVIGMALAILSATGAWPNWPPWTGWTALGVQATSTLLNWITPSRPERRLWAPITSALLILAALVVLFA